MSNFEPRDPLTDRRLTPDELRRLDLEKDRGGGSMWLWVICIAAVIIAATLGTDIV
jgi:hypothetical protein